MEVCVNEEKMGSYLQPIKSPLIASASGLGCENQLAGRRARWVQAGPGPKYHRLLGDSNG